ncbi:uncharacterized protein LOC112341605 [Selaginella moellendorffii]|uniref:uncharacterized protein LOC112341605 n=1 Tax=Selaginella moellendorffii TaxID=88036 RepID=UPI000D1CE788|nr:uncharacterized protein LOC112341605 [Selaginella moellendorffii]|eukprot:XP_024517766.1 uncharacterized protein LOC112341605 [Selaginella moellendorffii]
MLNTSYKIYAKVMALKLQPVMPLIIREQQTRFVPRRQIAENIWTYLLAQRWANVSNQQIVAWLLDFEKAYDRVDWDFLEDCMWKIGIPARTISCISLLYRGAASRVTLNGEIGPTFHLGRSVRQGCPLAPYLFLIVAETLGSFLTHGGDIKGLVLPSERLQLPGTQAVTQELQDGAFADDTALFLLATPGNLDAAKSKLEIFNMAAGAAINWNKSVGVNWGKPGIEAWGQEIGFQWLRPGEDTRYLGIQVGVQYSAATQDDTLLRRIQAAVQKWTPRKLGLPARIIVVKSVILPSIWYHLSIWPVLETTLQKVRQMVRTYMWRGALATGQTMAKVAWQSTARPRILGGLGIIDPSDMAKAMRAEEWLNQPLFFNTLFKVGGTKWPRRCLQAGDFVAIQRQTEWEEHDTVRRPLGTWTRAFTAPTLAWEEGDVEVWFVAAPEHNIGWPFHIMRGDTLLPMGEKQEMSDVTDDEVRGRISVLRQSPKRLDVVESEDLLEGDGSLIWWRQQLLEDLDWDPAAWRRGTGSFFSYAIKEARNGLLTSREEAREEIPKLWQKWIAQGVDVEQVVDNTIHFWKLPVQEKVKVTSWLVANNGLPVGQRFQDDTSRRCKECGEIETVKHALWECDTAKEVWRQIIKAGKELGVTQDFEARSGDVLHWFEAARGPAQGPALRHIRCRGRHGWGIQVQWDVIGVEIESPFGRRLAMLDGRYGVRRESRPFGKHITGCTSMGHSLEYHRYW